MFLTKLKNALVVLIVVSLIAYGGGLLSFQAVGAQEDKGGKLAGAGTAKDQKAAPILSAPLDIPARAALDESAEQQLKIAAEKLKAVTDEQTRKEAVKEVENAIKAVEALLRKDRQDRKTAYEKPKRVSLVLAKASAERRDKDVLIRCEAILDNATGKELTWQTSFTSAFPGLGLVVTDKDGRELAQEFSSQQFPAAPILSNYVLKQGNTPLRLEFHVELPWEVKVVKVRLLGALPGSNYKHLLSSDTLELTLRIPEGIAPTSNSPAGHLRGVIEKVDPNDPLLVQISLGSEAGLQKGHTLEVFRLQPQAEYLGTLRIESLQAQKSVGKLIRGKSQRLQVGDQVASQLTPTAEPKAAAPEGDVILSTTRTMRIPVNVAPERRGRLKQLRLFVSADLGMTWQIMASISPEEGSFPFVAPADGVYWLTVQAVNQDGTMEPSELSGRRADLKMLVKTKQEGR